MSSGKSQPAPRPDLRAALRQSLPPRSVGARRDGCRSEAAPGPVRGPGAAERGYFCSTVTLTILPVKALSPCL